MPQLPSRVKRLFAAAVLSLAAAPASGQEQPRSPQRGYHPTGTDVDSGMESINSVTGNIHLTVPLASLPPDKSGQAGVQLDLAYNSQMWDVIQEAAPGGGIHKRLEPAKITGWQYSYQYRLDQERRIDYEGPCVVDIVNGHPSTHVFKFVLTLPDGSRHTLHPRGRNDYFGDGYYTHTPNGVASGCSGLPNASGVLTYYTTDGTFIRVEINASGQGTVDDEAWIGRPWTIFLPDGRRLAGTGHEPTILFDRNNNEISILRATRNGNPVTYLVDNAQRAIAIEKTLDSMDRIFVRRHGAAERPCTDPGDELLWEVHWTNVFTNFSYPCRESFVTCQYQGGHRMIDYISVPWSTVQYTFEYYGDCSTCYGEIKSVRTPLTARTVYTYRGPFTWWDMPENPIATKRLQFDEVHDGFLTPREEQTIYSFTDTYSTITAPDGGQVRNDYFHRTLAVKFWQRGLVWKTQYADGEAVERYWHANRPHDVHNNDRMNPYVRAEFRGAGNPRYTAITEYSYDKNANLTGSIEYDFAAGDPVTQRDAAGAPIAYSIGGRQLLRKTAHGYWRPTPDAGNEADSRTMPMPTGTHPRGMACRCRPHAPSRAPSRAPASRTARCVPIANTATTTPRHQPTSRSCGAGTRTREPHRRQAARSPNCRRATRSAPRTSTIPTGRSYG